MRSETWFREPSAHRSRIRAPLPGSRDAIFSIFLLALVLLGSFCNGVIFVLAVATLEVERGAYGVASGPSAARFQ
jgi:hypothetical protein